MKAVSRMISNFDVVGILDTHVTPDYLSPLHRTASRHGCEVFVTCNPEEQGGSHVGGVAVFLKSTLLAGCLGFRTQVVFPGRAIGISLAYEHGALQIVTVYLPGPNDKSGVDWKEVLTAVEDFRIKGANKDLR